MSKIFTATVYGHPDNPEYQATLRAMEHNRLRYKTVELAEGVSLPAGDRALVLGNDLPAVITRADDGKPVSAFCWTGFEPRRIANLPRFPVST